MISNYSTIHFNYGWDAAFLKYIDTSLAPLNQHIEKLLVEAYLR